MTYARPNRQPPHDRQCAAKISDASVCAKTCSADGIGAPMVSTLGDATSRILPTPLFRHHSAPLRSLCDVRKASVIKLFARTVAPTGCVSSPCSREPTSRPSANKVNALRHINHGAAA